MSSRCQGKGGLSGQYKHLLEQNNFPAKVLIVIIVIVSMVPLLARCALSPPELTVHVDTTKSPYLKYERDHADCLERARSLYPVTQIQLRAQPAIYRPLYEAQRAYVIDCLEKLGYRVLKPGELVPF